jgi:hypothetical protein
MASTYLTRTNSSPTNPKKYTWSSWNKIDSGGWYPFFSTTHQGGHSYIGFGASGSSFGVIEHGDSAGTLYYLSTSSIQRDTSGWYHVVVQFDSTQSTASDRIKIYINNVLQTSFGNSDYPSQNLDSWFVDATTIEIGRRSQGSGQYYSGLISHAHFIDGTIYAPSTFGETDSTTGEWKINSNPGISTANYGNNGFWMFKDNNSLNDNSGNSNNFTLGGGTLTKTEDCPSNVFCVMNPLDFGTGSNNATLSLGNTKAISGNTNWRHSHGTLGVTTGKWYFEGKQGLTSDGGTGVVFGFCDQQYDTTDDPNNGTPNAKFYGRQGTTFYTPSGKTDNFFPNTSGGDILMVALDLDNNKIWFGTNGTWHNTNGSAGNTSYSSTTLNSSYPDATSVTIDTSKAGVYMPIIGSYNDGYVEANFGNGYFGTTQISSAGTNASNNGIFEYDVPTGFTALSTKGLNL